MSSKVAICVTVKDLPWRLPISMHELKFVMSQRYRTNIIESFAAIQVTNDNVSEP